MQNAIQITKEGLEALKNELKQLLEVKRPEVVDRLAFARTQGDLSENSDYQNAKEELEFIDGRIEELEQVIKNAVLVANVTATATSGVSMGTKVKVKVNGTEMVFHIVGDWEADPAEKKISHTSPLGQALLGKKEGDHVEVEAPAGKITYQIVSVE